MKVVINSCYGGFGLSSDAIMRYAELVGIKLYPFIYTGGDNGEKKYEPGVSSDYITSYYTNTVDGQPVHDTYWSVSNIKRDDPTLVQVVEEMGEKANGECAKLKVVEIPDGVEWEIDDYDGMESVAEVHRTWN